MKQSGETPRTVVVGATHQLEEPGTLDQVILAAGEWFETHFGEGPAG